jgi:hypothetical protein
MPAIFKVVALYLLATTSIAVALFLFFLDDLSKWASSNLATEHAYFVVPHRDHAIDASIRWRIDSLEARLKSTEQFGEAGKRREEALRKEVESLKTTLVRLESERTWAQSLVENLDKIFAVLFSCMGLYYTREGIRLQRKALLPRDKKGVAAS